MYMKLKWYFILKNYKTLGFKRKVSFFVPLHFYHERSTSCFLVDISVLW